MKKRKLVLILLIGMVLQSTIISRIEIFGVHANVILPLIIVISLFEGSYIGGVFGVCSGMIEEILFSPIIGLRVLYYFSVGYFVGEYGKRVNSRSMKPILYFSVITTCIGHLGVRLLLIYMEREGLGFNLFDLTLGIELLWNIGLTFLFFYLYGRGRKRKNYYGF